MAGLNRDEQRRFTEIIMIKELSYEKAKCFMYNKTAIYYSLLSEHGVCEKAQIISMKCIIILSRCTSVVRLVKKI